MVWFLHACQTDVINTNIIISTKNGEYDLRETQFDEGNLWIRLMFNKNKINNHLCHRFGDLYDDKWGVTLCLWGVAF